MDYTLAPWAGSGEACMHAKLISINITCRRVVLALWPHELPPHESRTRARDSTLDACREERDSRIADALSPNDTPSPTIGDWSGGRVVARGSGCAGFSDFAHIEHAPGTHARAHKRHTHTRRHARARALWSLHAEVAGGGAASPFSQLIFYQ